MGLYDIEEYDHIYVTVRRDKLKELKFAYEEFGWEEVEREEHTVYENLLDMTFRRPHRIADKDELLLLQVHLEEALNAVGKYERAPKRKTKAFCTCLGILAFLLLAIGIPLGIVPVTLTYIITGWIMAALGAVCAALVSVFGPRFWKYEKRVGERRHKIAWDLVIGICHSAREIRERGNEALAETLEPAKEVIVKIARRAGSADEGEELLARAMDVSISQVVKEAIAKRNEYAAEHEEAEAAAAEAVKKAAESAEQAVTAGKAAAETAARAAEENAEEPSLALAGVPATAPAMEPATAPATEPAAKPATEPAGAPAVKPATEHEGAPAGAPAGEPGRVVVIPAGEDSVILVPEPAAELETGAAVPAKEAEDE